MYCIKHKLIRMQICKYLSQGCDLNNRKKRNKPMLYLLKKEFLIWCRRCTTIGFFAIYLEKLPRLVDVTPLFNCWNVATLLSYQETTKLNTNFSACLFKKYMVSQEGLKRSFIKDYTLVENSKKGECNF